MRNIILVTLITLLTLIGCSIKHNQTQKYADNENFQEICSLTFLLTDAILEKSSCDIIENKNFYIIESNIIVEDGTELYGEICMNGKFDDLDNIIYVYTYWTSKERTSQDIGPEYNNFELDELRTMCRYD